MAVAPVLCLLFTLLVLPPSLGIEVGGWEGRTSHQITGTISFPNPNTVVIDNFSYDDGGIIVYLYYYPPGQPVDGRSGIILRISEGNGQLNRRYTNEQLVVPLPDGTTACDIGIFTVWCEPFRATFSRIAIPRSTFLNEGEGECQLVGGNTDLPEAPVVNFDNCEPFFETLQVSWSVDTDNSEVDFQICSCRPLDAGVNQYMAFGLSGRADSTYMIGADVTVAWVDNSDGMPNAVDYYLTGRVQCRGGEGACPDTMVTVDGETPCTDDIRSDSVVGGIRGNNQQCVIFSRPFTTSDDTCDSDIDPSNQDQYIVWANGGLGETAFIHFNRADGTSLPIHLGRTPEDRCSNVPIECPSCAPFIEQSREVPGNTTLRVRIGPSGQERGYMGITGQVGWGISWYIDDILIPKLVVNRGSTYTFIIEGGTDPDNLAEYHPFYITDSPNGGRLQNTVEDRARETVYAGFDAEGNPIGVGRFCEYLESSTASNIRESCGSFDEYMAAVTSPGPECVMSEEPGVFTWTPDETTPDLVYYQCATHLNLGWEIIVNKAITTSSLPPLSTLSTLPLSTLSLSTLSLSTLLLFALVAFLLGM